VCKKYLLLKVHKYLRQQCSEISTLCLREADQLDLLALLSTHLPLLTEVSIVKCSLLLQTKTEALTLPSLKNHHHRVPGCVDRYLEVLAGSCPQLEDLSISFRKMEHPGGNVGQFPTFDCIQRLLECCPRLIRLLWKKCDPLPLGLEDEKENDASDSDKENFSESISAAAVKAPKLERLVLLGGGDGLLEVLLNCRFELLLLVRGSHVEAWLGVLDKQHNRRYADRGTYSTTTT